MLSVVMQSEHIIGEATSMNYINYLCIYYTALNISESSSVHLSLLDDMIMVLLGFFVFHSQFKIVTLCAFLSSLNMSATNILFLANRAKPCCLERQELFFLSLELFK